MIQYPKNKKQKSTNIFLLFAILLVVSLSLPLTSLFAQVKDSSGYVTLPASEGYHKGSIYRFFWGKHYRKEWHTPVSIPITMLDTLNGGVTPYGVGGSRQTKSIRVVDKNDQEYVFRSLDKTFSGALPTDLRETYFAEVANDQVTIAHPYAALIVAPLAEAADIYHASPKLLYVPRQPALKELNDSMGNTTYLFEQRPDENWSTEANFGNSKKIISTEKMLENTLEDNDDIVDQKSFLRARLFDLIIGDWGRHEDQWRWATFKDGKKTIYKAIPRDRDNAFSKFDGFLLRRLISAAHAKHLQSFSAKIKDVNNFNFPARNLDRRFTNALTLTDWLKEATALQQSLTDAVIENAVKQMPAEVYPISGPSITAKLKQRRNDIVKYANTYFLFLNKEISIPLSEKNEQVNINRLSDTSTEVSIYKITKDGDVTKNPYFQRVFDNRQTKEIRIFGINGQDVWTVNGKVDKSIKFRLIGGPNTDIYTDNSSINKNGRRTIIYDNKEKNTITGGSEIQKHLSNDSAINVYEYKYYQPTIKKITPTVFFSNADRVFIGVKYFYQKSQWRKMPYGMQHIVDLHYSIAQQAFSFHYNNRFPQLIGKYDLITSLNYDHIVWTNFYGLGNETIRNSNDRTYWRYRSRESVNSIGLDRVTNNRNHFIINATFQTVKIIDDNDRYVGKVSAFNFPSQFKTQKFAGLQVKYIYQNVNDSVLPTKGFYAVGQSHYIQNIDISKNQVFKYGGEANIFLPVSKKFGFRFMAGASGLTGKPEFYQYNIVGNPITVRGYERDRYYGKFGWYNQNEFRWITKVRGSFYSGGIGAYALLDNGRVYLPGEKSNTIHTGYGGGVILAPFNRIAFTINYAKSKTENRIGFALLKNL